MKSPGGAARVVPLGITSKVEVVKATQQSMKQTSVLQSNFALHYLAPNSPTKATSTMVVSNAEDAEKEIDEQIGELSRVQNENSDFLNAFISMNPITLAFNNHKVEKDFRRFHENKRHFVMLSCLLDIIVMTQITLGFTYIKMSNGESPTNEENASIFVGNVGSLLCGLSYCDRMLHLPDGSIFRMPRSLRALLDFMTRNPVDPGPPSEVGPQSTPPTSLLTLRSVVRKLRRSLPRDDYLIAGVLLTYIWIFPFKPPFTPAMILLTLACSSLSRMSYLLIALLQFMMLARYIVLLDGEVDLNTLYFINSVIIFVYNARIAELSHRRDFRLTKRLAAENIDVRVDATTRNWFEFGERQVHAESAVTSPTSPTRDAIPSHQIRGEELELLETLGAGAFGEVVRAKWRGTEVAVKKIHGAPSKRVVMDFGAESAIMSQLRHPNIVLLLGSCLNPVMLVMELMEKGSLFDYIHKGGAKLDWLLRFRILVDSAKGMNFLHLLPTPIFHNDLKSLNLLLDGDWHCKVADFGFSRLRRESDQNNPNSHRVSVATVGWASPEAINGERLTEKNDVYSFGVVIFELLAEQLPYADLARDSIPLLISQGRVPDQCSTGVQEALAKQAEINSTGANGLRTLASIMHRCWSMNPDSRPEFKEIVQLLEAAAVEFADATDWKPRVVLPKQRLLNSSLELEQLEDASVKKFAIPPNELVFGPKIGAGAFGEVYEAIYHGTHVAVKQFFSKGLPAEVMREFNKECVLMHSLRHPNVVLFMGSWTQPPKLLIVTELLTRGSLYHAYTKSPKPTDERKHLQLVLKIAEGMALGLNYLHKHQPPLVHRDVKSPNILLDEQWNAKVADFGLSRIKEEGKIMTSVGSPLWAAPEVLRGEESGFPSDVYSFGIVVWESIMWQEPYPGMGSASIMRQVAYSNLRPTIPEGLIPLELEAVMEASWRNKPSERPTFDEIIVTLGKIMDSI